MPLRAFLRQVGGTTASLEICVILVQLENASCPILCNPLPKVRIFRLRQPAKALLPIFVTLFGMVTEVSALQNPKAYSPIVVTLFGMVTEFSALHI